MSRRGLIGKRIVRAELIGSLVAEVRAAKVPERATIVGIDGVDLSGKTTLAAELESAIRQTADHVVVIHGDDFLNPKHVRFRQGPWSARGFFEDFFDFWSLARRILGPLRKGEKVNVELPRVNPVNDISESPMRYVIDRSDIVIVEGLYLLRPELAPYFDLVIHLRIPLPLVMVRALARDVPVLGDEQQVRKMYALQSTPAHRIYEQHCRPSTRADIVIDNSDPARPIVAKCAARRRQEDS